MNLGFVTCVQIGLSCMEAIYEAGGRIKLAMTLPDDKAVNKSGRVYIDDFCNKHEIKLIKSSHVNNLDVLHAIRSENIDWLFIVGWSQIASEDILKAPRSGVFGMHPSLLPIGRGRAAIPWAILKSLDKTGVSLFKMDSGVDTGPVAAQIEIPLFCDTTATDLYEKVNMAHMSLIYKIIPKILNNQIKLIPQDEAVATIWPGRKPEDGEIDLNASVYDAEKLIRAVTRPYPGAFYRVDNLKRIVWASKVISDNDLRDEDLVYLQFHDGVLLLLDYEDIDSPT